MALEIAGYTFDGPYTNPDNLRDTAGIYAIVDIRSDGLCYVVDVGESGGVRSRLRSHEREDCWVHARQGRLGVAVLYTPGFDAEQRRLIEARVRNQTNPTCGTN